MTDKIIPLVGEKEVKDLIHSVTDLVNLFLMLINDLDDRVYALEHKD